MADLIKGNSESAKIYHYLRGIKTPVSNKTIAHDLDIPIHNVSSNMSNLRALGYATYTREGRKTFWLCHKDRLPHPQEPITIRKVKETKPRSSHEIILEVIKLQNELSDAIARELKTAEDTCFNDFLEFKQTKV